MPASPYQVTGATCNEMTSSICRKVSTEQRSSQQISVKSNLLPSCQRKKWPHHCAGKVHNVLKIFDKAIALSSKKHQFLSKQGFWPSESLSISKDLSSGNHLMTIKNKACKRRKLATNIEQEKQQPDCQVFRQCLSQNTVVKSYVGYIVLLETGTLKYQLLWPVMFRSFCSLLSLEAPLRFFFFFLFLHWI